MTSSEVWMSPENTSFEGGGDEALDSFLTPRQINVLQMRLAGLSQQEVADCLGTPAPISAFWRRGPIRI